MSGLTALLRRRDQLVLLHRVLIFIVFTHAGNILEVREVAVESTAAQTFVKQVCL